MIHVLKEMFPRHTFSDTFHPLSWHEAIEQVLTPEAAVLLVMEDLDIGPDDAMQVLKDSRAYGNETFPYIEPLSPVIKQEDAEHIESLVFGGREVIDLTI